MDELYYKLGQNIKKLRKELGFTQEKLSESTGLSPNFICLLESGKRKPSLETIYKLSVALNVPMHKLFYFADTTKINEKNKESYDKKLNNLLSDLTINDKLFLNDLIKTLKKYRKDSRKKQKD